MKVFKIVEGEHYYYGKYSIPAIGYKMFELGKIFNGEIFVENEPEDNESSFNVKTSIDDVNWYHFGCYNKNNIAYAMFNLGKLNSSIRIKIEETK